MSIGSSVDSGEPVNRGITGLTLHYEAETTWGFIAILVGLVLTCVCLGAQMFTTGGSFYLDHDIQKLR